ncbi:MAG: glucose-6-phosphate dehydrogenase [Candidatus Woesearchaeota archaeon]|nr:glucose-6-phosphate dehydrogenase [Candidatus Woesearchaeota archaeon]|tara:strand:- start:1227 stop:2744 length:1518 start_codon:yes stop_codon:yes gene_type:complete
MENKIEPCMTIIFGATGDLMNRKLLPAFYKLEFENLLHKSSKIIAFARKEKSNEQFRKEVLKSTKKFSKLKINDKVWKRLANKIFYHQSEFQDVKGFNRLKTLIKKICTKSAACNRVFYLSAPPSFFETIIANLKKNGLTASSGWSRIVFEKPFGHDLRSAKKLNESIKKAFKEKQIYRIDHYVGKELVQNLLVLRFANSIFEPVWNKKYIDHVQITVAEELGIETRGNYYDKFGALKDMVQNHMLQLVALTAMEPPVRLDAYDLREEKVKVLRAIEQFTLKDVKNITVRGQYGAGEINGKRVNAYRNEEKIDKKSNTETFVALKLNINNWRWEGIPFYLRTGKRLKERVAEINIVFKQNHSVLFDEYVKHTEPNMLIARIQPEEGISLQFSAKVPGKKMIVDNVRMDFCHECRFGPNSLDAYERLLYDITIGDQTLFTSWDMVEHSWKIVDKITKAWRHGKVSNYNPDSWGPKEADKLIEKDGRRWYKPQKPSYSELLQNDSKQ